MNPNHMKVELLTERFTRRTDGFDSSEMFFSVRVANLARRLLSNEAALGRVVLRAGFATPYMSPMKYG